MKSKSEKCPTSYSSNSSSTLISQPNGLPSNGTSSRRQRVISHSDRESARRVRESALQDESYFSFPHRASKVKRQYTISRSKGEAIQPIRFSFPSRSRRFQISLICLCLLTNYGKFLKNVIQAALGSSFEQTLFSHSKLNKIKEQPQ